MLSKCLSTKPGQVHCQSDGTIRDIQHRIDVTTVERVALYVHGDIGVVLERYEFGLNQGFPRLGVI